MITDSLLRKLRALADRVERGSTEAERENAAARLAEIMAKHQIESFDATTPEPSADEGRLDADDGAPPSRVEFWEKALLSGLAEAMGGRAWLRGRGRYQQMRMVGPAGSIGAARYMYRWLRNQINEMARQAARDHNESSNAWRRAYSTGAVMKVIKRMKDARHTVMSSTSTAMVLVDRQRQAVDARFSQLGELRKGRGGRTQRADARSTGYHDGDLVDLGSASGSLGEGVKQLKG